MSHRERAIDQQPQLPDPEHEKSPTQMGIFTVFIELLGAALLLAIGVRFLTAPEQPDAVAWTAFIFVVVLLFDCVRRLIRISTGKDRR